ncbi:MAG: quinoprotein dehydrogenase-associated putative ABC transporter substrate-binding protein [Gammaproteobacteria bacterium]
MNSAFAHKFKIAVGTLCLLATAGTATAQIDPDKMTALKVCADPFMLPFSNTKEQGFENKIAELFARKLGVSVQYEFFPQRMGFIRNTLRAEAESGPGYKCDLVINVPEAFELAATTEPYYTTSYVLIYAKGRGMDSATSPEMLGELSEKQGVNIKFGLVDRGPAQFWVAQHGLMGNIVPYQGQTGDARLNLGKKLIGDVLSGKIDATIAWGPSAGYFTGRGDAKGKLVVLPLRDDPESPYLKFEYSMAMGVRYGEKAWKDKVNELIRTNQDEIDAILTDYGVPLLPIKKSARKDDDD